MKDMHKTLLRIWLVIWVITLPLVHIHPEADHAHAKSGHVHGGTYHSILVNTPVHAHQGHDQEEHHHDGFLFLLCFNRIHGNRFNIYIGTYLARIYILKNRKTIREYLELLLIFLNKNLCCESI